MRMKSQDHLENHLDMIQGPGKHKLLLLCYLKPDEWRSKVLDEKWAGI